AFGGLMKNVVARADDAPGSTEKLRVSPIQIELHRKPVNQIEVAIVIPVDHLGRPADQRSGMPLAGQSRRIFPAGLVLRADVVINRQIRIARDDEIEQSVVVQIDESGRSDRPVGKLSPDWKLLSGEPRFRLRADVLEQAKETLAR